MKTSSNASEGKIRNIHGSRSCLALDRTKSVRMLVSAAWLIRGASSIDRDAFTEDSRAAVVPVARTFDANIMIGMFG